MQIKGNLSRAFPWQEFAQISCSNDGACKRPAREEANCLKGGNNRAQGNASGVSIRRSLLSLKERASAFQTGISRMNHFCLQA
jgi:hypothetical protein